MSDHNVVLTVDAYASRAAAEQASVATTPQPQPVGVGMRAAESPAAPTGQPGWASMVLVSLVLVAAVADLNLSAANVALPDVATYFDASQTAQDLVAVGYSLGLAASVLYLGTLGGHHGRKAMATGVNSAPQGTRSMMSPAALRSRLRGKWIGTWWIVCS